MGDHRPGSALAVRDPAAATDPLRDLPVRGSGSDARMADRAALLPARVRALHGVPRAGITGGRTRVAGHERTPVALPLRGCGSGAVFLVSFACQFPTPKANSQTLGVGCWGVGSCSSR